jgi:magnesium and cobalt transporter
MKLSEPDPSSPSLFERVIKSFGNEPDDQEALLELLRDATERGIIGENSLSMIEGVFQVKELQGRDIMIPRSRMVVLNYNDDFDTLIKIVRQSGHSRFPVIDENLDDVEGVLLAKDLLTYFDDAQRKHFNIKDVLRSAYFIPKSRHLNALLKDFKSKRNHMAVVVDEYGGTAGLVTIEDILEQIVGKIDDEHDDEEEEMIQPNGKYRFTVNGLTPLDEFNSYFKSSITNPDFETIGGVIMNAFGDMPNRGDEVEVEKISFKILNVDKRRIHSLQILLGNKTS